MTDRSPQNLLEAGDRVKLRGRSCEGVLASVNERSWARVTWDAEGPLICHLYEHDGPRAGRGYLECKHKQAVQGRHGRRYRGLGAARKRPGHLQGLREENDMSGYSYGEPEPKQPCPYCGTVCEADFCDVGVGFTQVGPYHCENCGASEAGPYEDVENRPDYDAEKGWYKPGSPAGETANTDDTGRIIGYREADTLYRAKRGVGPRY